MMPPGTAPVAGPLQSALDAAGTHASEIESLWWVFFWVSVVVFVAVNTALLVALFRRRRGEMELPAAAPHPGERRAARVVAAAAVVSGIILVGLLIASVTTGRAIAEVPRPGLVVSLTAKQWWWQIEYDHQDNDKRISTANELYIPVGVPVMIRLRSSDVIHSFWVPNLHGKRDIIPGREGGIVLHATRPGVFRGQCAEFCGLQHAKMALWVTAVPRADFERWADEQRKPSRIPSSLAQRQGQEVFMSSPCPLCHTIAGTDASGKTGPDLTHFASRRSIAAGTVPNRRGYLGGWILDPQHLKAGSYMPPTLLESGQLELLLAYMESLR